MQSGSAIRSATLHPPNLLVSVHVVLLEELPVLDESGLDVLVVHKLGEDEELLA